MKFQEIGFLFLCVCVVSVLYQPIFAQNDNLPQNNEMANSNELKNNFTMNFSQEEKEELEKIIRDIVNKTNDKIEDKLVNDAIDKIINFTKDKCVEACVPDINSPDGPNSTTPVATTISAEPTDLETYIIFILAAIIVTVTLVVSKTKIDSMKRQYATVGNKNNDIN